MSKTATFIALISLITGNAAAAAVAEENAGAASVETQAPSSPPSWHYVNGDSTEQWGKLSASYSLCNKGTHQSPIDIGTVYPYRLERIGNASRLARVDPPRLRFVMYPTLLEVTREANGMRVHVTSGSYTRVNRQRYELTEVQFHTPAEHLVNGHRYPAELQMIHRHNNALAIFSVFLEAGTANDTLQEIINSAPENAGDTRGSRHHRIDTALLLPGDKGYYQYQGSLSTPPCSEDITWFVMKKPIQASRQQLLALRGLLGDNARPVQDLAERKVVQTRY